MRGSYPSQPFGGYAALMSVLIITTLLMLLVFAAGTNAFLARFDILDYEDHLQARHYAVSCLSAAAFSLAQDHAYSIGIAGETIYLSSPVQSCHIDAIEHVGTEVSIKASSKVRTASARVEGIVHISSTSSVPYLESWKDMNAP